MVITGKKDPIIFKDYGEYFHYTRPLSLYQKTKLFDSFKHDLRYSLETSYLEDGWAEVVEMNLVEQKIESIKKQFNKDLYQIKLKINSGSKIRVKHTFWNFVQQEFSDISENRKKHILGNISYSHDPKDLRWIIIEKR
jgi:hypothetical protein